MNRFFLLIAALCAILLQLAACGDIDDYIGGNHHEITEPALQSDVIGNDEAPESAFEPPPETKPLIVIDP